MGSNDALRDISRFYLREKLFGFSEEPIKFASGILSPVYIDNRKILAYAHWWGLLIESMVRMIDPIHSQIIGAVETAAIPHGALIAQRMKLPMCILRKAPKDHGKKKRIEGASVQGFDVLVVEDHVTTAGSIMSAVEAVAAEGGIVQHCAYITSYGFEWAERELRVAGIKSHCLIPFDLLLETARTEKHFTEEQLFEVKAWRADPLEWTRAHESNSTI